MKEYIKKSAKLSHVIDHSPKVSQKKNAIQKMAWVITRDLNLGMSGSSNSDSSSSHVQTEQRSGGSSHGSFDSSGGASSLAISLSPTVLPIVASNSSTAGSSERGSKASISDKALKSNDVKEISAEQIGTLNEDPKKIDLSSGKESPLWQKIGKLKFHHRHILFDNTHKLPTGKANNIGYGGVLYSENSLAGYERNNQITNDNEEDKVLVNTIKKPEFTNYGSYNLLTKNCQHWVNDVVAKFNLEKTQEAMQMLQI